MYYICISIHTCGIVKYNMSIENYYIRNKIYIYCNKKDNTVIPKREVYIMIGVYTTISSNSIREYAHGKTLLTFF